MEGLSKKELRAFLECIKDCYYIHDLESLRQRLSSRLSKIVEAKARRFHEVGPPAVRKHCTNRVQRHYTRCETEALDGHLPFINDDGGRDLIHKRVRSSLRSIPPRVKSRTNYSGKAKQIVPKLPCVHLLNIQHNARLVAQMRGKIGLLEGALNEMHLGLIVQSLDGNVRLITRCAVRQLTNFLGREALQKDSLASTVFAWVKKQQLASVREGKAPSQFVRVVLQREKRSLVIRSATDSDQMSLLLEDNPTPMRAVRSTSILSQRETQILDL